MKLDPARIAGYRNFGTKLWNATRFAEMNGVARNDEFWLSDAKLTVNRWILTELTRAARDITDGITSYRFNEAGAAAYRFVWNLFCDWYVELLKPVFMGEDEAAKAESRATMAFVLDEIYKLLHPMMPFMTEELWAQTAGEGQERRDAALPRRLAGAGFRGCRGGGRDQLADRTGLGHPLGALRDERAAGGDRAAGADRRECRRRASGCRATMRRSSGWRASARSAMPTPHRRRRRSSCVGEATACLPLGTLIDLKAEAARLQKELAKVTEEIARLHKKLSNEKFVANAPEEVVAAEREKLDEYREAQAKLDTALSRVRSEG